MAIVWEPIASCGLSKWQRPVAGRAACGYGCGCCLLICVLPADDTHRG